jgi:hypothetical protein
MEQEEGVSAKLLWTPIEDAVDAFNRAYPGRHVTIQFIESDECRGDDGSPAQGFTLFPDDGGNPEIYIDRETPWCGVPDTIIHELAHVVAGIEADHGPEFEAAYNAIWDRFGPSEDVDLDAPNPRKPPAQE